MSTPNKQMSNNPYFQFILSFFTVMDLVKVRLLRKNEYTFPDSKNEFYLIEQKKIFESHKNSDDIVLNKIPKIWTTDYVEKNIKF